MTEEQKALMSKVHRVLLAVESDLQEDECLSDCPPEWPRCARCRTLTRVYGLIRNIERAERVEGT
jgi:hypothetical protein